VAVRPESSSNAPKHELRLRGNLCGSLDAPTFRYPTQKPTNRNACAGDRGPKPYSPDLGLRAMAGA